MDNGFDHTFQGIHIFGELYGMSAEDLNDIGKLEKLLIAGITASGASLCAMESKAFEPSGATLLALLSESHASIHTYPDHGALFFDAFTCGSECNPMKIAETLIAGLKPTKQKLQKMLRGDFSAQAMALLHKDPQGDRPVNRP